MYLVSFLLYLSYVCGEPRIKDLASEQLNTFKSKTSGPVGILTTASGSPVEYKEAMNTLNTNLIMNEHFMNTMTHFVRERIPERVVHAKGAGAFGYFEVTNDITNICKAKFFSKVGKKTPVVVRFSPIAIERGGSDTSRESRGFAVKFYTEEGNFDLVGMSLPIFALNDPLFFPSLSHVIKRNPATALFDENMTWDFLTSRPETLFMFMMVFSDNGIPDGHRHLPGFGVHTFQVVNDQGEMHFIRWHVLPDAGVKSLSSEDARRIAMEDSDYASKDLYNSIENGKFPSWTIYLQILSFEDVKNAKFNVFDPTKLLPKDKYPLKEVGRLILNRNPLNHFAEIEQLAFNPGNLVPGILGAPDKLFESRRFACRDAHLYRLGVNYIKITVNCPLQLKPYMYDRDGVAPVKDNGKDSPNYYPNSYNGPVPYLDKKRTKLVQILEDEANNFDQARQFYENEIPEGEKSRLVNNIVSSLGRAAEFLQDRAVKLFTIIHPDLGKRISQGLRTNMTKIY